MSNLKIIFNFEFMEMIKKKSVIISTLIISLILFGVTFIPRFINSDGEVSLDILGKAVIVSEDETLFRDLQEIFKDYEGIHFENKNLDYEQILMNGDYDRAFVVSTDGYQVFVKDDMTPSFVEPFEDVYGSYKKDINLISDGYNPEKINDLIRQGLEHEIIVVEKGPQRNMAFSFAMLFGLYILILMYGQSVATSVAREKDSRTMELLITSTKAHELILGKVFAAGMVGILQMLVIFFGLLFGYFINNSIYPKFIIDMIQTSLQLDVVIVYMIFSVLGYLLYLFIFAALGSLVSKVEDVAGSVTPVTFLFVFAYIIATIGMSSPDSTIVRVSSYIPFVSLFTTPIRYALTDVKIIELILSLGLMMIVSLVIMKMSIYIYRQGSLNYGNKMSLIKLIKGEYTTK